MLVAKWHGFRLIRGFRLWLKAKAVYEARGWRLAHPLGVVQPGDSWRLVTSSSEIAAAFARPRRAAIWRCRKAAIALKLGALMRRRDIHRRHRAKRLS